MDEELGACRRKALELLARRPHFRAELRHKLEHRGFTEPAVEAVLDRLSEDRYLDDRATAVAFVEQRQRRGPEGRARLRAELMRRGAPEEAIETALAETVPGDDLDLARQAAARWRRTHAADPTALARHLDRKGFSRRAIFTVLREL